MQSQALKNQNQIAKVNNPGLAKEKKKKGLTVTLHIGGKQVDALTDEQIECMVNRLSQTMSVYYTAHLEEFKKIKA